MQFAGSRRLSRCRRRDKRGTVRIVSHLPDVFANETPGRHRSVVIRTSTPKHASNVSAAVGLTARFEPLRGKVATAIEPVSAKLSALSARVEPLSSRLSAGLSTARVPAGAHTRSARHERRVQHAGGTRPLVTAMGVFLAAAPWAFVLFAPMSEGASAPTLVAQASASPSPPDYPPLLVVPLDSSGTNGDGNYLGSGSGLPVVSSAGPASPPPQWLVNSQLRQPASAVGPAPLVSPAVLDSLKATGIPRRVLASYISAAATEDRLSPTCGLSWQVLAGIGFIESGHAHSGGSHNPNWDGIADPPIYGPLLDGQNGIALISDSDQGLLDGNATYDRAVGPMQFLPSTWREYEVGASGHSAPNPQNIDDATLSAARYLCATGPDLRTPDGLIAAVYSYNHSFDYVTAVLSVAIRYAGGNLPGGSSALAELPALAQTAVDLPTAIATAPTVLSPTPSSLPYPTPAPTLAVPPASQPPYYAPPPAPTYAAPSAPASPLSSSPPASASPTPDPSTTVSPSPSASPNPSPTPSPTPTDSAPASSAPASSAPASASPSATPAPTSETP
jgi:hypothetical protein